MGVQLGVVAVRLCAETSALPEGGDRWADLGVNSLWLVCAES
jgi:hypothetical protein